jgi:hypothetical protein
MTVCDAFAFGGVTGKFRANGLRGGQHDGSINRGQRLAETQSPFDIPPAADYRAAKAQWRP